MRTILKHAQAAWARSQRDQLSGFKGVEVTQELMGERRAHWVATEGHTSRQACIALEMGKLSLRDRAARVGTG